MGATLSIPPRSRILQASECGESRLIRRRRRRARPLTMVPPGATMQYRRHRRRRRQDTEDPYDDHEYGHCLSFRKIKGPMSKTYTVFIYGGQCVLIIGIILTIAGFSSGAYGEGKSSKAMEQFLCRLLGPVMVTIGLCMATSGCSVHKRSLQIRNRVQDTTNLNACERFDPSSSKDVCAQLACAASFLLFLIGICFTAIGFSVRKYKTGVEYMQYLGPVFIVCGFSINIASVCYIKGRKKQSGVGVSQTQNGRTVEENDSGSSSDSNEASRRYEVNRSGTNNITDNVWSTNFDFATRGPREPIKPPPYQQVAPQSTTNPTGFPIQEPPPRYSSAPPRENETAVTRSTEVPNVLPQRTQYDGQSLGSFGSSMPPILHNYCFVSECNDVRDLPPPPSYEAATNSNQNHESSNMPNVS